MTIEEKKVSYSSFVISLITECVMALRLREPDSGVSDQQSVGLSPSTALPMVASRLSVKVALCGKALTYLRTAWFNNNNKSK